MSQPPKSTMRAPASRWAALSGVVFGMAKALPENEKGPGKPEALAWPLCPLYLRDYGAARGTASPFGGRAGFQQPGRRSPESGIASPLRESRSREPGSGRSFCLRVCGRYPFGGRATNRDGALPTGWRRSLRGHPTDVNATAQTGALARPLIERNSRKRARPSMAPGTPPALPEQDTGARGTREECDPATGLPLGEHNHG